MNDQLKVRRQKMDEMRENGIEPFGQRKFDRQDLASTLEEKYGNEDKDARFSKYFRRKVWQRR